MGRPRRWLLVIGGIAAVVVLGLVPLGWLEQSPSLCLFRAVTGVECPGCGMVRALACLARADVAGAVAYNAASVVVGPLLVAIGVSRIAGGR